MYFYTPREFEEKEGKEILRYLKDGIDLFYAKNVKGKEVGFFCLKRKPRKKFVEITCLVVFDAFKDYEYEKVFLKFVQNFALFNGFKKIVFYVHNEDKITLKYFLEDGFEEKCTQGDQKILCKILE